MGPLAWADRQGQAFRSDGVNQVWTYCTDVFDLRPLVSEAYGHIPNARPINHEGALGQSVYLNLIVGESSNTIPPALRFGMRAETWQVGSGISPAAVDLYQITKPTDVTIALLAGGDALTPPFAGGSPASVFSITPTTISLRFWQVYFRLTVPGVAAVVEPYFIQASLH